VAGEILRQSLATARALGTGHVLLTCGDGNTRSIAVIERCGGRLENVVITTGPPGQAKRQYWIA
jgi:predicted acetyltransferase